VTDTETQTDADEVKGRGDGPSGWSLGVRTIAVGIFDALAVWALPTLFSDGAWTLLTMLVLALALVNWAYLSKRTHAARWLTPGLVLMAIFVVFPVIYTFYISTTNWRTGNVLSKDQVVEALEGETIEGEGAGAPLDIAVYEHPDGRVALLVSGADREPFLGEIRGPDEPPGDPVPVGDGGAGIDPAAPPATVEGFELLDGLSAVRVRDQLDGAEIDLPSGERAVVRTLTTAVVTDASQRFEYDPETDTLRDLQLGVTCEAGVGQFVCADVPEEEVSGVARENRGITCDGGTCDDVPLFAIDGSLPGWRTVIGFDNYVDVLTNPRIRGPFVRVFAWNTVFALASVLLTFALGLGLAMLLRDESMKGRAFYRSVYIIPYAIPAFLSIFVWRGLLNTEFGKVNIGLEALGLPAVDWLGSPVGAMAAILLVNLWLGFPYMFLISSGALTAIPEELIEASRIDGASPYQTFRHVTLPLLLVSTAPLLIGAFAFNFNNFALIYLLTQGGPPLPGYDVPVGATDILISFTFNLAAGSGRGNQFGIATAIIVLIFIVLAIVSASSFRLTKKLEEIYEQ
jgi:ABC-type sugar transport system permease subunit